MVKELRCRDLGFDCTAVVRGDTVDEVMVQAGPHTKEVHGVEVTPQLTRQMRGLIRDV